LVGVGLVASRFCRFGVSGPRLPGSTVHRDPDLRAPARGAARNREAEMTEPGAVLDAAHTAIADLAAVLVAVRAGLGGECVRAGSHLEMGEIDLLSARDAVEKAAWKSILRPRCRRPGDGAAFRGMDRAAEHGTRGHSCHGRRGAIPTPGRRPAGTRRPGSPGPGQGELFSVHDVTSCTLQLA